MQQMIVCPEVFCSSFIWISYQFLLLHTESTPPQKDKY